MGLLKCNPAKSLMQDQKVLHWGEREKDMLYAEH